MPVLDWVGKRNVEEYYKNMPLHSFSLIDDLSTIKGKSLKNKNLFIQGDNLLTLKSLLPMYEGKIKCIYIDPPYNTGKEEWIYNDNVNDPRITQWINKVVGKEAEDLNRHDKWLSMMYPRLLLAEKFLSEDGVIFVSIDDNEIQYLKILMDEIFKRKNLLANFVWESDGNMDNQAKVKICHEYILCYCKDYTKFPYPKVIDPSILKNKKSKLHNDQIKNTIVKNGSKNPVSTVILPKGFPCEIEELFIPARTDKWPHYDQDLIVKDYKLVKPIKAESGWSSKKRLIKFIENDFKPILDDKNQNTIFKITKTGTIDGIKERKKENQSHVKSVLTDLGNTQSTSGRLKKMNLFFDYPKPTELLEYLISMVDSKDFIVLDFFSGSGSTAEAILSLNKRDQGNRKFIMVEWDEKTLKEVSVPRIKEFVGDDDLEYGYLELSNPLFNNFGMVYPETNFENIIDYLFYREFKTSTFSNNQESSHIYCIGEFEDAELYLLHETSKYFNVGALLKLDLDIFNTLNEEKRKIIYGDSTTLSESLLKRKNIIFKQIPADL